MIIIYNTITGAVVEVSDDDSLTPNIDSSSTLAYVQYTINYPDIDKIVPYISVDVTTVTVVENVDAAKADKKAEVKETARRKILNILPEHHQRNTLYRYNELLEKQLQGVALTTDEQTELDNIKALWTRINNIRNASDQIEAEIDGLPTLADVLNYDVENNILWPE